MILIGDIASPTRETTNQLETVIDKCNTIFRNKRVICNFEGLISEHAVNLSNKPLLYNHPLVPRVINTGLIPVLCMANNHILDLPEAFKSTIDYLSKEGALHCGAGISSADASARLVFFESNKKIVLINACWDFLLYNQSNPSKGVFVAEINETKLVDEVVRTKQAEVNASIIVFLHWNLDLEILPFPMHRKLSRALIDAGADLIVGSHSHCVQGGEKYRGKYIIYGLGNFFIPHGIFAQGKVTYPDFARTELLFEWDPIENNGVCHWFEYHNSGSGHDLLYKISEKFEDSLMLKQYSPYQGMTNREYYKYFKANRRKRFFIPIYRNHKSRVQNRLKTLFLKNRARFAYLLARLNLIKWQS